MGERAKIVVAALLGLLSLVLIWGQLDRSETAAHLFGIAAFAFPGLLVMLTGRIAVGAGIVATLVAGLHLWGLVEGIVPFVVGIVLVPLVVVSFVHAAESHE